VKAKETGRFRGHRARHLMDLEHTLCGMAIDIYVLDEGDGEWVPDPSMASYAISCSACAAVINLCKGVRLSRNLHPPRASEDT